MEALKNLLKVVEARRGVYPGFNLYHVLKALELVGRGRIGRPALRKELGLGDASTRTLLTRLRSQGLIRTKRPLGAELTDLGREVLDAVKRRLTVLGILSHGSICGDCVTSVAVLRDSTKLVEKVGLLRLRDLLVKAGADGAVILYYINGKVMIPYVGGSEEFRDRLVREVLENTELRDNDVIVVAMCASEERDRCTEYLVNALLDVLIREN